MFGLDYNEQVTQELRNIPMSFHHIDEKHQHYHMPLHWHRHSEIVKVLHGKLKVYMNEEKIVAGPNDIIFINREIIHGYFPTDCVYEVIDFDADEILLRTSLCKDALRTFTNSNVSVLPFFSSENTSLHHIADRMFAIASKPSSEYSLLLLGTLFELLGAIYVNHHYTESLKGSASIKAFKPLLDFIEKSYMKSITLTEMAQVSGMSISHFSALFRDFFHQTPIDYLNSYRIERACLFLINSELSVTEIAYRCGFNDSAYFVKVFKKYKSSTPKKYRTTMAVSSKNSSEYNI